MTEHDTGKVCYDRRQRQRPGAPCEVVPLDDHREIWSTWWASCLACAKTWVAQTCTPPEGWLQCPACKRMRGIRTCRIPAAGE